MNKALETKLGNLLLKNPIMNASGVAGHSDELEALEGFDLSILGAFVTKGITFQKREGNSQPRIVEVIGGMLNSIGLKNQGLNHFMEKELPKLKPFNIPIIVNISGSSIESNFEFLCEEMVKCPSCDLIQGIEINVSCPNLEGDHIIGTDPLAVELIVKEVKDIFPDKLIITKLTPNVTDIVEIAEAAIQGGTDALSMINTIRGCAVDIYTRKLMLGNKVGGLSGPIIKPVGLLAVHECFTKITRCRNKEVPIIGIGGIINYKDVLEYIMVGASAIQIGTGFFYDVNIYKSIIQNLEKYFEDKKENLSDLIGVIS